MNRDKLDLFNKKKIKKLEQENYELHSDIEGYIKNEQLRLFCCTVCIVWHCVLPSTASHRQVI